MTWRSGGLRLGALRFREAQDVEVIALRLDAALRSAAEILLEGRLTRDEFLRQVEAVRGMTQALELEVSLLEDRFRRR